MGYIFGVDSRNQSQLDVADRSQLACGAISSKIERKTNAEECKCGLVINIIVQAHTEISKNQNINPYYVFINQTRSKKMSLLKKFETQSARVKGVCFHPTRPWVITSLHSGAIQIWDYNMHIILATFDQGQGPVRGVDFHPHLPLFVSGADNGNIRVWNYKQKRCLFVLKGHIDYIRTTYFHHELPWILSASDDQTMRIWNYQSRNCINIITGHSHYVMCAQFHREKDYIVSASLDSTVRLWDFSVLRKKLTQTKNMSGFVGIQIQSIAKMETHEKGCNWACFHPTTNMIASGSDDRKIKLWKFTNEVAWEHSTILGHKNNVSCLLFDEFSQNLITNSEDKTLRIWNIETKTEIITERKQKSRYWILAMNKKGSLLAAGHDEGLDMFQLNKERVPHAIISNDLIVFAQGFKTYLYDTKTKNQKMELYQYKEKNPNSVSYIEKVISNPFEQSMYMVQINEVGQKQKNFMIKKKQSYLNFPTVTKQYDAIDSCFTSSTQATLLKNEKTIQLLQINTKQTQVKQIAFKSDTFAIRRIFSSNKPGQVVLVTSHNNQVSKLNIESKRTLAKCYVEDCDVRGLVWGFGRVAIVGLFAIVVADQGFQGITVIREKFPIKSVFWESEKLIFYTTINHLKYAFMNGETGVLKTIDEPFHILQKLEGNKFLAFNKRQKVFEVQFPDYTEIEFKMAISERKVDKIKMMLSKIGESKKKVLIKNLVENGFADLALSLVTDPEEKFSLAIQSSNFELAFEICNKINTQQYWKMLGEEALKQGIFQAYEVSCQKLKNFDQLNFLYSLQNNTDKLQKMLKLSKKTNNTILSFNSNLYLNNGEIYEETLREAGLEALAALSREAYNLEARPSGILAKLGCRPLTPVQAVGQDNFANWPHNIQNQQLEA